MATPPAKPNKKKEDAENGTLTLVKNAADLQRLKLEKLMKNPDKPVIIPDRPREKGMPHVPEFVRNVMGSSAGAGSGEFHVYRHLRRKEYARQKFIQERAEKETLEEEYHRKIEENKRKAEEETAKKRAKRLKKKQKKSKVKRPKQEVVSESESESESEKDSATEHTKLSSNVDDGRVTNQQSVETSNKTEKNLSE